MRPLASQLLSLVSLSRFKLVCSGAGQGNQPITSAPATLPTPTPPGCPVPSSSPAQAFTGTGAYTAVIGLGVVRRRGCIDIGIIHRPSLWSNTRRGTGNQPTLMPKGAE